MADERSPICFLYNKGKSKQKNKRVNSHQSVRLCEGHSMGKWQIRNTRAYLVYPDININIESTHVVHRHIYRQNTNTDKIKIKQ